MKIIAIEPIIVRIPFTDGGTGIGITPQRWNMLDIVLVRIETDTGLVGWGEAFGYFCYRSVALAVREMIAPILIGRALDDPAALNLEVQRKLALFGRYGITIFALSGVDIALWDLKAKAEGRSLAALLSASPRADIEAYASLVRYGDSDLVARFSERACSQGYRTLKLHEVTMPEIRAGRAAVDPAMKFTVDVNCNWSAEIASDYLPELAALDTLWLEEPVFPPEDFETMTRLRGLGVALSAGENACTAFEFERLMAVVDFPQPSVTKVGGVSEFRKIAQSAQRHGRTIMPHSPYFGPGYHATLQLAAANANVGLFEYLYVEPEMWIAARMPLPENGRIQVPEAAGIGFEPDVDVLERYRVAI
ncbi:mandelate racemase/muconate lactonizing enzyme family protein [Agrobacterium rhizogenes]|uniref:mandelate racemase/muconate lactonizing enzyme family protein n=1 Tax=Rhizobium rhizogenes TaxID=359 RepID=UPI001574026F|nr:mandelate racemase/muconate lactonizing enzyme family protein [Rhizobium rhizogenes]NTH16591.1 mandelate racemase/muconate lactonizing enzyme family protein [Rhizobium rhizogenes]